MECNHDQSDDCYNRAVNLLREGNTERAILFLKKSYKLYPNARAQRLLEQIQAEQQQQQQQQHNEEQHQQQQESHHENSDDRDRGNFFNENSGADTDNDNDAGYDRQSSQSSGTPVDTTGIEDEDIKRILEAGDDYYKVFDLPKTATVAEIKKKYRKLAIKTHPDKSTSKGAEEAFKSKETKT